MSKWKVEGPDAEAVDPDAGIVYNKVRSQGKGAAGGGGQATNPDEAPTTGDNALEYQGDEDFCDKSERESRVEGYGPYAVAPLWDDTDSEDPPSGFLKGNNVRDRI